MSSSKNLEYKKTSFLNKSNSAFIEQMYVKYVNNDPNLPESWKKYFIDIGDDINSIVKEVNGPSWSPSKNKIDESKILENEIEILESQNKEIDQNDIVASNSNSIKAVSLIRAYRQRGHLLSKVDPLSAVDERITAGVDRIALPVNAFSDNIEEQLTSFSENVIQKING